MFSMVAFDLVPAALKESGLFVTLLGLAGGMLLMLILDVIIPSKTSANRVQSSLSSTQHISHYKRMGILIALGIAIHNFAEGMAIGSGYVVTQGLGIGVAIVMAIHDVPEGVALAAPLRMGGVRAWKVLAISIGAGLPTAIGGLIGGLLGSISEIFLCICLSLSGGAMLSIVADQLLPDAKEANDGHTSNLGFGIGVILGIILTTVL
jgi:ZIP family zinc transporter